MNKNQQQKPLVTSLEKWTTFIQAHTIMYFSHFLFPPHLQIKEPSSDV